MSRLIIEIASLMYVLILVYLVLSKGQAAVNLAGTGFSGVTGLVKALQGR